MDKLKNFIKAFLTLFAVMRLMEISTTNPVSIILFIAIFYIYNKLPYLQPKVRQNRFLQPFTCLSDVYLLHEIEQCRVIEFFSKIL